MILIDVVGNIIHRILFNLYIYSTWRAYILDIIILL